VVNHTAIVTYARLKSPRAKHDSEAAFVHQFSDSDKALFVHETVNGHPHYQGVFTPT
jgi:hypothetical protein